MPDSGVHFAIPAKKASRHAARNLYTSTPKDYGGGLAMHLLKRKGLHVAGQPRLIRQWILLRALCARRCGTTLPELAEEVEVGQRTVRRDLEIFRAAGFPLEEIVGQFGRKSWRIAPDKAQPGLSFTFDEAIALYLGRHLLEPLAGTVFWEAAQRAFKNIRASLGNRRVT